jgi:hypothetical protein
LFPELKDRDDMPFFLEDKKMFKSGLNGIYLPMQHTDWLHVEVARLLIGLTKIFKAKSSFDHPSAIESPLRLPALRNPKKQWFQNRLCPSIKLSRLWGQEKANFLNWIIIYFFIFLTDYLTVLAWWS